MSDTATSAQVPGMNPTGPKSDDPSFKKGSSIDPNKLSTADETLIRTNDKGNQQPVTPVREKRRLSEMAVDTSWLPPGWVVEDRVRASGATAGTRDKYYFEPVTGRRFRSKKDVQYYLETGTLKKRGKVTDNVDADTKRIPRVVKKKSGANTNFAWNFDSFNVPDRTEWFLTEANEDTWTPFIDGKKVPLYDKEQWDFTFASLTTSSHGYRMH